jgi:LPS sulfotransferase NodH
MSFSEHGERSQVSASRYFIVTAPRSGSTLLFETLAANERFCTLAGEAHWLIERQDTGFLSASR